MAYVTYVARDSLISGHVAGTQYDLELTLTTDTVRSVEDLKNAEYSLSGKTEVQFFGRVIKWSVELFPATPTEADAIREFLDSTADGQVFTFDPYGTVDDPSDDAIDVIRDDDGYTESRAMPLGTNGGADDYIQFSFKVRSA